MSVRDNTANVHTMGIGNLVSFIAANPEGRTMDVKRCVDELNRREREYLGATEPGPFLPLDRKPEGGEKTGPSRIDLTTVCVRCGVTRGCHGAVYPHTRGPECIGFSPCTHVKTGILPSGEIQCGDCEAIIPPPCAESAEKERLRCCACLVEFDAKQSTNCPDCGHYSCLRCMTMPSLAKDPAPAPESSEWVKLCELSPGELFEMRNQRGAKYALTCITDAGDVKYPYFMCVRLGPGAGYDNTVNRNETVRRLHTTPCPGKGCPQCSK